MDSQFFENDDFQFSNWAQTVKAKPRYLHQPKTKEELQSIIVSCRYLNKESGKRHVVRAIGIGHSPNEICVSSLENPDASVLHMVDLKPHMSRVISIDASSCLVTFEGGTTLKQLLRALEEDGSLSMPNLPSITDLTFAGLIATGTHGTGITNQVLASLVTELEFVSGTGDMVTCSRATNEPVFLAMLCSLGALGIVTRLTLKLQPAYKLECYERLQPLADVLADHETLLHGNDFFRFWWVPHTSQAVVWTANRTQKEVCPAECHYDVDKANRDYEDRLFEAVEDPTKLPEVNKEFSQLFFAKERRYIETPEKALTFNCLFPQHTIEYSVPLQNLRKAMEEIQAFIAKENLSVNFPLEVRFTGKDDIYLSPNEGWDSCWIGVVMYRPFLRDPPQYKQVFASFERIVKALGGRPHWAKAFDQDGFRLEDLYPRTASKFKEVRAQLDPEGLFLNDLLRKILKE